MIDTAWAQGGPGGALPQALVPYIPLILIVGVFYLMLIRPQQQQAKEHREMLNKLKRNDEIITNGGLYGKIITLTDEIITLEIAPNVRVRVSRAQISSVVSAGRTEKPDKTKDNEK